MSSKLHEQVRSETLARKQGNGCMDSWMESERPNETFRVLRKRNISAACGQLSPATAKPWSFLATRQTHLPCLLKAAQEAGLTRHSLTAKANIMIWPTALAFMPLPAILYKSLRLTPSVSA